MHRNQKSQKERAPCHGSDQSQPTCMCAASQQAQPVISQSAPKATFTTFRVLTLPVTIYKFASFDPGPSVTRFVSPPDQPPRL